MMKVDVPSGIQTRQKHFKVKQLFQLVSTIFSFVKIIIKTSTAVKRLFMSFLVLQHQRNLTVYIKGNGTSDKT